MDVDLTVHEHPTLRQHELNLANYLDMHNLCSLNDWIRDGEAMQQWEQQQHAQRQMMIQRQQQEAAFIMQQQQQYAAMMFQQQQQQQPCAWPCAPGPAQRHVHVARSLHHEHVPAERAPRGGVAELQGQEIVVLIPCC
jgi:hypothetical protein